MENLRHIALLVGKGIEELFLGTRAMRLAIRRINRAAREGSDTLDLSFLRPRSIEAGLLFSWMKMRLPKLKKLDLNNTIIRVLPGQLAGLTELTHLDLYNSKIKGISKGILKKLTKLERLDLRGTPIRIVPDGLDQMLNLQLLYVNSHVFDRDYYENLFPKLKELIQVGDTDPLVVICGTISKGLHCLELLLLDLITLLLLPECQYHGWLLQHYS